MDSGRRENKRGFYWFFLQGFCGPLLDNPRKHQRRFPACPGGQQYLRTLCSRLSFDRPAIDGVGFIRTKKCGATSSLPVCLKGSMSLLEASS